MFRVVLKVEKAHIRVKEPMNLETVLRKNNWHMVIPGGAVIKSGQAHFNSFIEFYVSKEKPDFILDLVVSLGQTKKFGGRCSIDLSQLSPLTSHHLVKKLQKCPDEKSTLQLDVLYMQSNLNYLGKDLLSLHQIQTQAKNQMIRQMWEKQLQLKNQNQILLQERFGLVRQNEQLFHGQFAITQDIQDKTCQFQSQIFRRAIEIERIEKDLVKEQEKIARMVNIINESHNSELVSKMTDILNRSQY